jgi:hypothetical protein
VLVAESEVVQRLAGTFLELGVPQAVRAEDLALHGCVQAGPVLLGTPELLIVGDARGDQLAEPLLAVPLEPHLTLDLLGPVARVDPAAPEEGEHVLDTGEGVRPAVPGDGQVVRPRHQLEPVERGPLRLAGLGVRGVAHELHVPVQAVVVEDGHLVVLDVPGEALGHVGLGGHCAPPLRMASPHHPAALRVARK